MERHYENIRKNSTCIRVQISRNVRTSVLYCAVHTNCTPFVQCSYQYFNKY